MGCPKNVCLFLFEEAGRPEDMCFFSLQMMLFSLREIHHSRNAQPDMTKKGP
jgi:hypothetical protein